MADTTLECIGLACPMPIVKLTKASRELASGDTITVTADDPGFEPDIQAWVEAQGHGLVSLTETDGVFTAVIKMK
jgi:tRNA 2-thiouridine synthesizing protein A